MLTGTACGIATGIVVEAFGLEILVLSLGSGMHASLLHTDAMAGESPKLAHHWRSPDPRTYATRTTSLR